MADLAGVSDEQLATWANAVGWEGYDWQMIAATLIDEVRASRAREAELARWEFFPDGSAEEDWTSVQCPDCRSFDARIDGRSLGEVVATATAHAATAHGRKEIAATEGTP